MGFFSKRRKKRVIKEYSRKAFHVLAGFVLVSGYYFLMTTYSKELALLAVLAVLLGYMVFESIRLSYVPWINRVVGVLFRKHEYEKPSSPVNFLMAFIICFALFEFEIALVAVLMLIFGDMISAVMGVTFGKTKLYGDKTYVGTLSGFAMNILVGYAVLGNGNWEVFVGMAVVATVVELFTTRLDDNMTVPLATVFIGHLLFNFL
jgi:dolichol kinase